MNQIDDQEPSQTICLAKTTTYNNKDMYILHGFLYTEYSLGSLLASLSAKLQKWKLICTGRAVAWEKVHMPQFAEPGMKKEADEKVQIRSC